VATLGGPAPYLVGTGTAASATFLTVTPTTASSAGDTLVVGASCSATSTVSTIVDTAGNTYVQKNTSSAQNPCSIWVAQGATRALSLSSTITVTFNSITGTKAAGVIGCSGLLTGVDQNPAATSNAGSTAPSITSGTLSTSVETAVALCVYGDAGGTSLVWTSPWTALFSPLLAGPAGQYMGMAWNSTVASPATTALTAAGTITSTRWCMMLLTFANTAVVTQVGSAAMSPGLAVTPPPPSWASLEVAVTSTGGDWMLAICTWRQYVSGENVGVVVGDDVHNYWEPLGAPTAASSSSGITVCSIWYAPAARKASAVTVAPTGGVAALACNVLNVHGMSPWLSLVSVTTGYVVGGTTLAALGSLTPSSYAIMVTACGSDNNSDTVSLAGTGWIAVANTPSTSNLTDHTNDLTLTAAYQVTSGSVSATWSTTGSQDLCGIVAGVLVSTAGPAQPNPYWPATYAEIAPGYSAATRVDSFTWTAVTPRSLALSVTQGRQYQLAQLQTGSGSVDWDNPDGALIPPGTGSLAGLDSGTPFRVRAIWQGGAWQVQWSGNGATANPQIDTTAIFPVVPGRTYSAAAWLGVNTLYTPGVTLILLWFTSGFSFISSVTSGAVLTSTLGPVLATASGAAPSTAAWASVVVQAGGTPAPFVAFSAAASAGASGYLVIPPAVAWSAENGATAATLASFAPDLRGPPQPSPYGAMFSGYMQKWPQQWDPDTQRGISSASIVDSWNYVNGNLAPILLQEIQNDNPYAYWPMTDAAGSTQASNQAAGNINPLVVLPSKYGAGGATYSFGENSQALLGTQGTIPITNSVRVQAQSGMFQETLATATTGNNGYYLTCPDNNYPTVALGVTVEMWFQFLTPVQTTAGGFCIPLSVTNNSNTTGWYLVFPTSGTGAGNMQLWQVVSPTIAAQFVATISTAPYFTFPSLTHFALTFNATTWTAYIDGSAITSGTWTAGNLQNFTRVSVCGLAYGAYGFYSGYAAHVAVTGQQLARERLYAHYNAGVNAMTGDIPTGRVERLIQAAPYLGRRVMIGPGTEPQQTLLASCQDISGQPAATSINNIVTDTAPATLVVTNWGEVCYFDRNYLYNQPVKWVFGDQPWLGEIPYEPDDFFVDYDPTRIINDIQLNQLDNQDIVLPTVSQTASQLQYGDITFWQTGYLEGDITEPLTFGPGLQDLANWIFETNSKPFLRPSTVSVDAATYPAAFTMVTTINPGDMVTVNRRPPTLSATASTSAVTLSFTGRVSQVQRSFVYAPNGTSAKVTLTIDPAPEAAVLTADDPVHGQLNGTNVLPW
jgi:hypothetical protein